MTRRPSEPSSLRALFRELRSYLPGRRRYVELVLSAFFASIAEAGSLVLLTLSAASVVTDSASTVLAGISIPRAVTIGGAAGLLVLRLGLMWLNVRLVASMAAEVQTTVRRRLLESFVDTEFERQAQQSPQVLQDMLAARADMLAASFMLVSSVAVAGLNLAVLAGSALVLQPLAVLGLALVATLLVFALRPLNRHVRRLAQRNLEANQVLVGRLGDLTSNYRDVTAFAVGRRFVRGMDPVLDEVATLYRRKTVLVSFLPHVYQTLGLGLAVGGLAVSAVIGQERVAVLGAVVLLLLRSVSYGQQLLSAANAASDRLPAVVSVSEVIADYRASARREGGTRPEQVGSLRIEGLSYRYPEGEDVLRHVDLVVAPGEKVGIVGPSGSGKSTLLQVICGLRRPTGGQVTVAGVPFEQLDPEWWAGRVAMVPQDARLLSGTLAENIAFHREIDTGTVEDAGRRAQLGQDLVQLGGLDGELSYQGRSLSGGQIQRLAIARALAGGPELLLLDEPTSALDIGTEQRLQAVLDALHGQVTMIIVAHRLSTVSSCDRVIVLEAGKVLAEGPSVEILESFGRRALEDWELVDGP